MTELKRGTYPAMMTDPFADATTQPFWDAALQDRLVAPKCTSCGTFVLTPQPFCFNCQGQGFEWVELPGTGTIYTFTVVRHPLSPALADVVPYVSGIIELDGTQGAGARLMLNITDCDPETVRIGDQVQIWFDKISATYAMPRARPLAQLRQTGGMTSAGQASAGRPRRFEPADELRLLFDAALVVMQRNGYADAAVADILAEAGLSTRSFYRHFQSKDQLLCALYRHEAEGLAGRLTAKVRAAATPLAGLDRWIEEIMSLGYDRRKAARVAVLGSPGAMRAEGYAEESRHAGQLLTAPLQDLLAAGRRDGTFPLAEPASDAPLIQSAAWSAAGLNPLREPVRPRADAFQSVRSFCWRALGVQAGNQPPA